MKRKLILAALLAQCLSAYTPKCEGGTYVSGHGTITSNRGGNYEHTYTGDIYEGKKSGKGVMSYPAFYRGPMAGTVYDGEWEDDEMNGEGVMTYPADGDRQHEHSGTWVNGMAHGHGVRKWGTGTRFERHFSGKFVAGDIDENVEGTLTYVHSPFTFTGLMDSHGQHARRTGNLTAWIEHPAYSVSGSFDHEQRIPKEIGHFPIFSYLDRFVDTKFAIQNKGDYKVMDIYGGGSAGPGKRVIWWNLHGGSNQIFTLKRRGTGLYSIHPVYSEGIALQLEGYQILTARPGYYQSQLIAVLALDGEWVRIHFRSEWKRVIGSNGMYARYAPRRDNEWLRFLPCKGNVCK